MNTLVNRVSKPKPCSRKKCVSYLCIWKTNQTWVSEELVCISQKDGASSALMLLGVWNWESGCKLLPWLSPAAFLTMDKSLTLFRHQSQHTKATASFRVWLLDVRCSKRSKVYSLEVSRKHWSSFPSCPLCLPDACWLDCHLLDEKKIVA